jgi:hypothetical protein
MLNCKKCTKLYATDKEFTIMKDEATVKNDLLFLPDVETNWFAIYVFLG